MEKYNSQKVDAKYSIRAIRKIIPILSKAFGGEIIIIEEANNETSKMLDMYCGIDLVVKTKGNISYGVASRVQFHPTRLSSKFYPYDSFTIRTSRDSGNPTEKAKRTSELKGQDKPFSPLYTIHVYFDDKTDLKLLSIGIVKTEYLYKFYEEHPELIDHERSDQNFDAVYWNDMEREKFLLLSRPYMHEE